MVIHCICFFKWLKLNQRNRSGLESGGGGALWRTWNTGRGGGGAGFGSGLESGEGQTLEMDWSVGKHQERTWKWRRKHSKLPSKKVILFQNTAIYLLIYFFLILHPCHIFSFFYIPLSPTPLLNGFIFAFALLSSTKKKIIFIEKISYPLSC